ncbi:hypothetical protein [Granulosicoccus antarcticus]|uniref:Uncharacterized protein n=1 Tax=Granulosicoccus antarcticus IMCC3135 TaxID=1192854 RepID=A0A2Z2NIK7_9GAMM|nr:hypothetical protein [Granulosicoccus antarcticus]ASJ70315.1 hypothetical protein IMCC3135_00945 [Granulosicoccus antarcticus IMCC3135]
MKAFIAGLVLLAGVLKAVGTQADPTQNIIVQISYWIDALAFLLIYLIVVTQKDNK